MHDHITEVEYHPACLTASFNRSVVSMLFFDFFFNESCQAIQKPFAAASGNDKTICKIGDAF
jgi:hypothetical protein